MLQTVFRNPLAGPSVFGINSGAGLGVALVMLFLGGGLSVGSLQFSGFAAVLIAAFFGALAVMAVIFFFSTLVRSSCHAADYRHHDWLHLQFCHLAA